MIDMRTSLPATAVAIVCMLIVMIRVATAPDPVVPPHATPAQMKELAEQIAVNEQNWAVETRQNFPRDNWSQRDDFHGREYRRVTELAKERKVRIEDILRAVDDDIHTRRATNADSPDQRNARAMPCKPRPFYD
jgi:hypothetical protein